MSQLGEGQGTGHPSAQQPDFAGAGAVTDGDRYGKEQGDFQRWESEPNL